MLPGWLAALTLIAIAIGAVAANVLNIYSGAMAFLSMGIPVHMRRARAYVALAFGVVGFRHRARRRSAMRRRATRTSSW